MSYENLCPRHHIPLDKRTDSCPLCQRSLRLEDQIPVALRERIENLALGAQAIKRAILGIRKDLAAHRVDFQHPLWFLLEDLHIASDRISAVLTSHQFPNAEDSTGRLDSSDVSAADHNPAEDGREKAPQ